MNPTSIEDRFDDLMRITYAIKGLGMAIEDCSTSMSVRNNKIDIEEITYALSDSIKLMAITLGDKLEDMKREITEMDVRQQKQASDATIEALDGFVSFTRGSLHIDGKQPKQAALDNEVSRPPSIRP